MSVIKIKGSSANTGDFTIQPPNSATDRTLTLPDAANGTILSSESSIPLGKIATPFVSLTADGSQRSSSSSFSLKLITWNESSSFSYDPDGIFNSSTNRIVPTVAGYYGIHFDITVENNDRTLHIIRVVNSATKDYGVQDWDDGNNREYPAVSMSTIEFCDGVDDYIEFYSRADGTNKLYHNVRCNVFLIRAT